MTKIRDHEHLLDAAAKVFAAKGFDAARLEDIAAELGVLPGSLYYYVSGKADLLYLVQRRRLQTIVDSIEATAASDLPASAKLATSIHNHLQHLDAHWPESSQWFTEPTATENVRRDEVRALNRRYLDALVDILRQGVATGYLRADLDAPIAARGILGMLNWMPRWYQRGGRLQIDEIGAIFTQVILDGLRASR